MTRATGLCGSLAVFFWLGACAVPNGDALSATAAPPEVCRSIVFVSDGAGGFEGASRTIRRTVAAARLPLDVRGFHWTHGYCRILADHVHAAHVRREGRKLAEQVLTCRQEEPEQPIFLVGHSAGCGVVLMAAEQLPPNTVERIVLLAPAVSAQHDLRPALRSSRQGIDAFTSRRDWACLGVGILLAGTSDRCWMTGAAGKIGFQPKPTCSDDRELYTKLREYPWQPSLICTGHKGGHYGCYQPGFLHAFVFPLLR